jgi:acetyl esterase/lipase
MYLSLTILASLSALPGLAPFIRPRSSAAEAPVWLPKLLGGALLPVWGAMSALAALAGPASLSGLGLIYAHRSGWRLGGKDMGTRPFFRRLTRQGHLVLGIAYSLWPAVDLPAMVAEVNQAIFWLKAHGPAYGVSLDHIVVMGGSAGGHLALLAAYTPGHPPFRPAGAEGDSSVWAAVAFYPPVDLLYWDEQAGEDPPSTSGLLGRIRQRMMTRLCIVPDESGQTHQSDNIVAEMLGGTAAEIPGTYRLLSPIHHAGAHFPPTLLLQGSDDVFGLAPAVRRLHERLTAASVPSTLVEFPHAEHPSDLLLPRLSPVARTSTRAVEKFLVRMG